MGVNANLRKAAGTCLLDEAGVEVLGHVHAAEGGGHGHAVDGRVG